MPNTHFFRYLQIRSFVRDNIDNFEDMGKSYPIMELLSLPATIKKSISKCVKLFSSEFSSTCNLKESWEKEIGTSLPDNIWNTALARIHSCSINSSYRLTQFKVIHRYHYSKVKLHKFYNAVSPKCDRCRNNDGTLLHLFWDCPYIYLFWIGIFSFFSDVYSLSIPPDRDFALFGASQDSLELPLDVQTAMLMGTVVAKRLILKDWKSKTAPSFKNWLSELFSVIHYKSHQR